MIRISEIREGLKLRLFVEGTLSDGWVDALETRWIEVQPQLNGVTVRIDLSGVTYVDDKGRGLLAQMTRGGAELWSTGIMTRAVIEEINREIESERDGGFKRRPKSSCCGHTSSDGEKINARKRRTIQRTTESRN